MTAVVESSPLPARADVRGLVEGLLGRAVELDDADPVSLAAGPVVAVYVTDGLTMTAVAVVDLPGAARLGGALAMLPKGGVDDVVDEGELPGALRDNCYEVLNILASVFNAPGHPHVRLYAMYAPGGDQLPADAAALAQAAGPRLDVALTVGGYGRVTVSVVVR